ncbi:hypothetical protein GCM10017554_05120 [Acinetobacter modestus]|nr:hypothetical protein GCM10017554_05120 [Acinetobacter modestus]
MVKVTFKLSISINFSTTYTVVNKRDYTEIAATTYNYLLSTGKLKYIFKTT